MKTVAKKDPLKFCIIGGGLTGTSMLCQFVAVLAEGLRLGKMPQRALEIHIIEKNRVFGPGFPHSDRQAMSFHLINMCARDMSILLANPNDFQSWADRHMDHMAKRFSTVEDFVVAVEGPDSDCRHYPRPVMGEYLKARFSQAVSVAEEMGIRVRLYPEHEVTNLFEAANERVQIKVLNLESGVEADLLANRVLLATGHWFEKGNDDGYFVSPWPAGYLQSAIPEGADVAIIGTSLSAIDAVLTLTAAGSFSLTASGELNYHPSAKTRKLTLYSRKGLLPTVRGRNGPYRNRFLTAVNVQALMKREGELSLDDIFALLKRDLDEAYGRPFPINGVIALEGSTKERLQKHIHEAMNGDGPKGEILWQTVLQQIFPFVRQLFLALSREERVRFERDFSTLFFTHAAPMPPVNALKMLALMEAGIVTVRQTRESSFTIKDGHFSFFFKGPHGEKMEAVHPYVVDARGQGRFYNQNPQVLAVNLLESGTVEIEPLGLESGKEKMTSGSAVKEHMNGTGSLWVDPRTHHVRRTGTDGHETLSKCIYAVGAMTRGQIIDASMAHGSAVSTQAIAEEWVGQIFSPRP